MSLAQSFEVRVSSSVFRAQALLSSCFVAKSQTNLAVSGLVLFGFVLSLIWFLLRLTNTRRCLVSAAPPTCLGQCSSPPERLLESGVAKFWISFTVIWTPQGVDFTGNPVRSRLLRLSRGRKISE